MPRQFTDEQHDALATIAEFDHVFAVLEGGEVSELDRTRARTPLAPEALDPEPYETTLNGWHLPLSGLTGQHGYSGPWLHNSEIIAGGVAEAVLAKPGYWVAICASYSCSPDTHPQYADAPDSTCETDPDHCVTSVEGWTLAHRPFADTKDRP